MIQVTDFWSRLQKPSPVSYTALKIPNSSPDDGFQIISDPVYKASSPHGWLFRNGTQVTTIGNNAYVSIGESLFQVKIPGQPVVPVFKPLLSPKGLFDSNWEKSASPTTESNQRASCIQIFYLVNVLHDIFYQYGFTEAAGNFQVDNFNKGGLGNDALKVNNQNDMYRNDAQFATPPDGQQPVMDMFLFDAVSPERDGSLDSMIPIHEFTHGVTKRLTGGSRNAMCLQGNEPNGLSEGWSDAMAVFLTRSVNSHRNDSVLFANYVVGGTNATKGIRPMAYSTDFSVFPDVYSNITNYADQAYPIGAIWANALYEMYWNLVDNSGFHENWYDSKSLEGNIVAFKLVVGGLIFQPCNPTFLQARDAIIQADKTYYDGKFNCLIWKAFAKRGMGTDAAQKGYSNGFGVPPNCK